MQYTSIPHDDKNGVPGCMKSILFVCMGNICRSPIAEGVFRKLVSDAGRNSEFEIDSAGTIGYHVGHRSDRRMRSAALKRGYELDSLARLIDRSDFDRFDLIIAMDDDNFRDLERMSPGARAKVVRMCDYCEVSEAAEVPDPYYGGEEGFGIVIDILEDAYRDLHGHTLASTGNFGRLITRMLEVCNFNVFRGATKMSTVRDPLDIGQGYIRVGVDRKIFE